jgi:hypothetical protein
MFSDLNKFLKSFIIKLAYIDNILNVNSSLLKNSISQLNNLIISDSIILLFIEEQIIIFNNNIKDFLFFIQNLGNKDTYLKIIKLFGNMYTKKIINAEDIPISLNLKRIQVLNNSIKYYNTICNYYKFIKEDIIELILPVFKLIIAQLIEILKFNSLHEIEYTISNIWKYILSINKFKFNEKEDLIQHLSNEMINIYSKKINTIDDINATVIVTKYLLEILSIRPKSHFCINEIVYHKISNSIINYFKPDNDEYKISKYLNNFINNLIINNQKDDVITILLIVTKMNNIDIFINGYYDFLIKRLTNNINLENVYDFNSFIQNEIKFVSILLNIKIIGNNLYRINKVINDTHKSFYENQEFNKLSNKLLNVNISVITTSFKNWDVNQTEGIIDHKIVDNIKDTQLGKYLKSRFFQQFLFLGKKEMTTSIYSLNLFTKIRSENFL